MLLGTRDGGRGAEGGACLKGAVGGILAARNCPGSAGRWWMHKATRFYRLNRAKHTMPPHSTQTHTTHRHLPHPTPHTQTHRHTQKNTAYTLQLHSHAQTYTHKHTQTHRPQTHKHTRHTRTQVQLETSEQEASRLHRGPRAASEAGRGFYTLSPSGEAGHRGRLCLSPCDCVTLQ